MQKFGIFHINFKKNRRIIWINWRTGFFSERVRQNELRKKEI